MTTDDLTPEDRDLIARILDRIDVQEWERETFGAVNSAHLVRTINASVGLVSAQIGVGFNIPDPVQREIIEAGGTRLLGLDIAGETRTALFRAMGEARADGLGARATARRIRSSVSAGRFRNAGSGYRAKLIARTETAWAQGESTAAAYEAAGVQMVEMVDDQIGYGDADCVARNGRVVTVNEYRSELAAEHPNHTLMAVPAEA